VVGKMKFQHISRPLETTFRLPLEKNLLLASSGKKNFRRSGMRMRSFNVSGTEAT